MKKESPQHAGENGSLPNETAILSAGALHLLPAREEAFVDKRRIPLNYVECQILRVLIEERPHVVTRTELMMAGWGSTSIQRTALIDEMIAALQIKLGEEVTIKVFPGIGYSLE